MPVLAGGEQPVGNPVRLFELVVDVGGKGDAVDPVCRMCIDRAAAAGRLRHGGTE